LAITAEEKEHASEAERLADHEVDQAFASALRLASIRAQHLNLTGDALSLSQKVEQLQQTVKEDQATVDSLNRAAHPQAAPEQGAAQPAGDDDDLEVAKAQLGLDSDQLADAQEELAHASGDNRSQIQAELSAHETAMKKYDSGSRGPEDGAIASAKKHGTLATRIKAWNDQLERTKLIQEAAQQAQDDIVSLKAEHKTIEAMGSTGAAAADGSAQSHASRLASIKERGERSQLLTICNDRIQTEQQLAAEYGKWSAQVQLQHRILLHLILQSLALIAFILICVVLCDAIVRRLMVDRALERKQMQTLRSVLQLAIQVIGGLLILLVVFGWPRQMSTVLGLTTAGLTIAMQDFILAFFGWFILMGKNGMRLGDWVEIDGVGGEVTEIGLMSTTLLETGDLADRGHPTGRRITFLNSFAIRGKYFNFSTAGQWMWDEIAVTLPLSDDTEAMVERIHKAAQEETKEDARIAENEWKRGTRDDGLSRFNADPKVNLRPTGTGVEILVRYVTRASERFGVRNRLYQRVIDLLHKEMNAAPAGPASADVKQ